MRFSGFFSPAGLIKGIWHHIVGAAGGKSGSVKKDWEKPSPQGAGRLVKNRLK